MTTTVAVRERPILFSGRLVRAILEDRKSVTRRVVKPPDDPRGEWKPVTLGGPGGARWVSGGNVEVPAFPALMNDRTGKVFACPYGAPGDRLWVKETHRLVDCTCPETCRVPGKVWYEADHSGYENAAYNRLRPSIHMPRWASRILLEVTEVRVERLRDITEAEARAEGVAFEDDGWIGGNGAPIWSTARGAFGSLWDSLNAARGYGWDANPWVWVVRFRRVDADA